jgi:hypothetical protein
MQQRWRDAHNMQLSEAFRGFVNYHRVTMLQLCKRSFTAGEAMAGLLASLALAPLHVAAAWLVNPRAVWAQLRAVVCAPPRT